MRDRRLLANIILIVEILIAVAIITLKMIYYINKLIHGRFDSFIDFLIWTSVSIIISAAPVTLLIIPNVADLIGKEKIIYENFLIPSILGIVANIMFEYVSSFVVRNDIVADMLICHYISIISFVISIFLNKRQRDNRRYNLSILRNNENEIGGKGDRYI